MMPLPPDNRMEASAPRYSAPLSKRSVIALRFSLLAVSLVLGLLAAEAGLRLAGYSPAYVNAMGSFHEANPVTGHRGKPNFRARFKTPEFDILIAHNKDGFRRQEFQNNSSTAARKICVFGDSFVWGWGVEQGEVFTDQLSRLLPEWRVNNFGINGTGTVAQYELFSAECRDQLQTGDVVVVAFFGNDFADNVEGSRFAKLIDGQVVVQPVTENIRHGWKGAMQESSYLFNYLSYVINRWQLERRIQRAHENAVALAAAAQAETVMHNPVSQKVAVDVSTTLAATPDTTEASPAGPPPAAAPAVPSLDGDAQSQLSVTRHYLQRWKQDCTDRKVRFVVAYIPGVGELDEGRDESTARKERAFRQAFTACTDSLAIEVIDLLPGMLAGKRDSNAERVVIPKDGHWNAAGHRIVAGIIASRLVDAQTARR